MRNRAIELQLGCPDELEVLLTYPGGARLEEALHQEFATEWIRGEWFMCSERVLRHILRIREGLGQVVAERGMPATRYPEPNELQAELFKLAMDIGS